MSASKRTVFVTVGATAPFDPLIEACLRPETLEALTSLGYTDLRLQYGNSARKETLQSYLQEVAKNFSLEHKINISGFDFAENLVSEVQAADLVISHAGSGSILDALRQVKKLIVVPNTVLMDNHQKELAEELERQGYLVEGSLKTEDSLPEAIYKAEKMEFRHFPRSGSDKFSAIVDEEMGFDNLD